ncbi:Transposase IS200 like protein [Maioricimonas rarisocia]|uniref:Transposase IS200 like protein n=1 Tax=Maioricimonas rarisocia TaxID=2528026 RepID=A0A517ZF01_9PLAN|nr:transposase [Maioricimonas rarisocia]QDU41065.1 Transposase IS200 like protein [Maioricimonas rarisocia]
MSDSPEQLEIYRRRLPHWRLGNSVYFVTFRIAPRRRRLDSQERSCVLARVVAGDPGFYRLAAAVVMPDHVHLLLKPNKGVPLSRILKGIKGTSARELNRRRHSTGPLWQDETWDRIVRDEAEYWEKYHYIHDNPYRAGLVDRRKPWPAWYGNKQFLAPE